LRSPASAASRMRVANNVLLDCACSSGDNELHAKSSATCMLLTVSGRKYLPSAAMSVPKEQCGFLTLPRRAPPRLSDTRPTARVFYTAKSSSSTQVLCPLWVDTVEKRFCGPECATLIQNRGRVRNFDSNTLLFGFDCCVWADR